MRLSDSSIYAEARDDYLDLRRTLSINQATVEFMRAKSTELDEISERPFCIAGLAKGQALRKELTASTISLLREELPNLELLLRNEGVTLSAYDKKYFERCINNPDYHANDTQLDITPTKKKIREFRCQWKYGDTFAYRLNGEYSKEIGIDGKYCLIRKIDQCCHDRFGLPATFPIVYLTICDNPDSIVSGCDLEQSGYLRLQEWPLKTETKWEYRAELRIKSKKELDSMGLYYIGCYPHIRIPQDELRIIHWPVPCEPRRWCRGLSEISIVDFEKSICDYYRLNGIEHSRLQSWNSKLFEM